MTDAAKAQAGELEEVKDAGLGPAGTVKRWLMELELADSTEKYWREQAKDAIARIRDEKRRGSERGRYSAGVRYNILYSNIQTICPALYNQQPKPDIRRRFKDADPVGKEIADVMERSVSYTMDAEDFDRSMRMAVRDSQTVGRGITRIKYEPLFETEYEEQYDEMGMPVLDDMGEPVKEEYEALKYEEICFEHVNWADFRRGPGRIWEEVEWVAFKHILNREEGREKFGPVFDDVELDYTPSGMDSKQGDPIIDTFKRAIVWEIWCEETKKVYFIAPSLKERPLKVEDDPLKLSNFFPIPRPLYATENTDSLEPIEPYRYYKDQAEELDEITKRISGIIKACKVRGIYDTTIGEMSTLMDAGENILVPSENVLQLVSAGGIDKAIWVWPIEKIAGVLVHLYTQRESIKTTIYEITGIADIMRGSSNASETLGAQQLKAQFGTMRLDDMRREVQRYARDLVRMAVEVMAEQFRPETLMAMTGKMVTPDMLQIMRQDGPRGFRIDIETDSTIAGDVAQDQKNMTELLNGIASFVGAIGPIVQEGYIDPKAAEAMLKAVVRRFKLGREVEDALDQGEEQGGQQEPQEPQGPSPEEMAMQQQAQQEQAKQQAEMAAQQQKAQIEQAKAQADIQTAQAKMQAEIQATQDKLQADIVLAREKAKMDMELAREELAAKMGLERYKAELAADVKREGQAMDTANKMMEAPNG